MRQWGARERDENVKYKKVKVIEIERQIKCLKTVFEKEKCLSKTKIETKMKEKERRKTERKRG